MTVDWFAAGFVTAWVATTLVVNALWKRSVDRYNDAKRANRAGLRHSEYLSVYERRIVVAALQWKADAKGSKEELRRAVEQYEDYLNYTAGLPPRIPVPTLPGQVYDMTTGRPITSKGTKP